MKVLKLKVKGLHCPACKALVEDGLIEENIVSKAEVDLGKNTIILEGIWDNDEVLLNRGNEILKPMGYTLRKPEETEPSQIHEYLWGGLGAGVILILLLGAQFLGVGSLFQSEVLDPKGAFILGMIASISTCFALVGGLLVTYTAALAPQGPRMVLGGLGLFHLGRLGGFFLLGGLLGLLGDFVQLDYAVTQVLLGVAVLILVGFGLQLLGVLKPRSGKARISGLVKKLAQNAEVVTGLVLGLLTFFLPCGFTQSVQFQALALGDFFQSGLLMGIFALGTLPVLGLLSLSLARGLQGSHSGIIARGSGFLILGLGIFQGLNLLTSLGILPPLFTSF